MTGRQKTQEAGVESRGQTEEVPTGHTEEVGLLPEGSEKPGQMAQSELNCTRATVSVTRSKGGRGRT